MFLFLSGMFFAVKLNVINILRSYIERKDNKEEINSPYLNYNER